MYVCTYVDVVCPTFGGALVPMYKRDEFIHIRMYVCMYEIFFRRALIVMYERKVCTCVRMYVCMYERNSL